MDRDSQILQLGFMAVGMSGDMDGAERVLHTFTRRIDEDKDAPEKARIPRAGSEAALTAWGLAFRPTEGIARMFGSVPCNEVDLPAGWRVDGRGAWNHLYDDQGRERLRWYVHGWDPVSCQPMGRFNYKLVDLGPTDMIVQCLDGETVIHVVPGKLPHARIFERYSSGGGRWDLPDEAPREQGQANYDVKQALYAVAKEWLNENRPGWQDDIKSWLL